MTVTLFTVSIAAMKFTTVEELAAAVEAWCRENEIQPANGQASVAISPRNVRYYRSLGLLDAADADSVAASPYGEKHFLQLVAIRLLQAKGLPLTRIQQLLMGRSLDDLRRVKRDGLREATAHAAPAVALAPQGESWRVAPIDRDWLLVSRDGSAPTAEQLEAIREVLSRSSRGAAITPRS